MTVSSLCTYVHLTDKCNNRKAEITRITPHHMSGHHTGKWCVDYFCDTTRQCSANYCIGYDGDIAQNVDEDKRAWTSSSQDNDTRAITVELSNVSADSSEIPDATVEAFIELCVDLFQRYPSLGGRANCTGDLNGNITFHRWFADTDCPGAWMMSNWWNIQNEINKRLDLIDEEAARKIEEAKAAEEAAKKAAEEEAKKLAEEKEAKKLAEEEEAKKAAEEEAEEEEAKKIDTTQAANIFLQIINMFLKFFKK